LDILLELTNQAQKYFEKKNLRKTVYDSMNPANPKVFSKNYDNLHELNETIHGENFL